MYSDSGIASSSSSVRSRPALVFQALASFGSALCACRGVSVSCLFICRVGGRGGANRSANREVGGGRGACTGATKYLGVPRPGLRGTKPFGLARGAPGASVGTGTATLATRGGGRSGRLGRGARLAPGAAGFGAGGTFAATGFLATGCAARLLRSRRRALRSAALGAAPRSWPSPSWRRASCSRPASWRAPAFFLAAAALPLAGAAAWARPSSRTGALAPVRRSSLLSS